MDDMEEVNDDGYFYENRFPVVDELVMVKIVEVSDIGMSCSLLEYNNIEGFIAITEISKRMKDVHRIGRIGQKFILQVTNVIPANSYIELSKKYVDSDDVVKGTEKYNNAKTVHNIVKQLAEIHQMTIQDMYKLMVYPLYETYDDPYNAFKLIAASGDTCNIYSELNISVPDNYLESLIKLVKQQLTVQPVKIAAEVDVTSFTGGIDDIKYALNKGKEMASKDFDIKIQLVASPTFMIFTTTTNEPEAIKAIINVSNVIKTEILKMGGEFVCKELPYVVCK